MIVSKTICFFPRERLEQQYYTLATGSITEQDDMYSGLFPDLNLFSNIDPVVRAEFILRYIFMDCVLVSQNYLLFAGIPPC